MITILLLHFRSVFRLLFIVKKISNFILFFPNISILLTSQLGSSVNQAHPFHNVVVTIPTLRLMRLLLWLNCSNKLGKVRQV